MTEEKLAAVPSPIEAPESRTPLVWKRVGYGILAAAAVLYLASVTHYWYFQGDGSLYLILGRNLAEGRGYTQWGEPHVHVPPGFPLFIAGMMKIGLGSIWCLNLSMTLFGMGAIFFAYRALRDRLSRQVAILTIAVVAFSYWMHFYSTTIRSDVPFMFLLWAGIYCCHRGLKRGNGWLVLGTLFFLAGCWTRVVGIPLALSAGVALLLERRPAGRAGVWGSSIALLGGVVATAIFFWMYHAAVLETTTVPSYSVQLNKIASRTPFDWLAVPFINLYQTSTPLAVLFTNEECKDLGWAIFIFWIPIAVGIASLLRRGNYLLVLAPLGYLAAILLERALITRYLLPISPMLVCCFIVGTQTLFEWTTSRVARVKLPSSARFNLFVMDFRQRLKRTGAAATGTWRNGPRAAIVVAVLFLAMNAPDSIEYTRKFYHENYMERYHKRWVDMIDAAEFLSRHAENGERYVSSRFEREYSFLSRVPSLPLKNGRYRPAYTPDQFRQWLQRDVNFVILNAVPRPYYAKVLNRSFLENEGLHLVFERKYVQIYSVRPIYEAQAELVAAGKLKTKNPSETQTAARSNDISVLQRSPSMISKTPRIRGALYVVESDESGDEFSVTGSASASPLFPRALAPSIETIRPHTASAEETVTTAQLPEKRKRKR